jgi:hypothetical protein
MKKGKWLRFGMGVCMLVSLLFLPGSNPDHAGSCALDCLEEFSGMGYLEINNNTIYNIVVSIRGSEGATGPFKITGNPSFMRIALANGKYRVFVFVCMPTPDQERVFYRGYAVNVPDEYKTVALTVTTPTGYIPVPGKHIPF